MKTPEDRRKEIKNTKFLNLRNRMPCNECEIKGICPEYKKNGKCTLGRKIIAGRVQGGLDPVQIVEELILKLYEEASLLQLSAVDSKSKEVLNKYITNIGNLAKKKFDMENTPRLDVDVHIDIFDLIDEADRKSKKDRKD